MTRISSNVQPVKVVVIKAKNICVAEIDCYVALCDVIDCMVLAARNLVDSDTILRSVETFLARFEALYGLEWSTPKFHWMLHFKNHFEEFLNFVSCWVLERKHKEPKGYGQDIRNTTYLDKSVLHELICESLHAICDPNTYVFNTLCVLKPRAASATLVEVIRHYLRLGEGDFSCEVSSASHPSEYVYCCSGDVVLFQTDPNSDMRAGELLYSVAVEGEVVVLINEFTLVSVADGAAIWRVQDNTVLEHSMAVVDVVVWSKQVANEIKMILPRNYT